MSPQDPPPRAIPSRGRTRARARPCRRRAVLLALGLLAGLADGLATRLGAAVDAPVPVGSMKASYLAKLPLFITWPENCFPDREAPVILGILGNDPFGSEFDGALRGLKNEGRGFEIRRFREPAGIEACHILFIGESEEARLPRVLAALEGRPVLTIGDTPGLALRGAMFNFIVEASRVRFECNREAVRKAGLRVNGKLLQISRIVRD